MIVVSAMLTVQDSENIDRFLHLREPLFCFPFQTDQLSLSKEIDNSEVSLIFFIKVSLNDLLEIVCLSDIFLTDGQKIAIKKGSVQGVAIVGKQGGKILS